MDVEKVIVSNEI
jgi:hypothetical protein